MYIYIYIDMESGGGVPKISCTFFWGGEGGVPMINKDYSILGIYIGIP